MEEKKMDFEEAMIKLEQIANELEKGNLTLDDSVKKFEEGMELSGKCSKMLEQAEKRISVLIENSDGLKEEDFIQKED